MGSPTLHPISFENQSKKILMIEKRLITPIPWKAVLTGFSSLLLASLWTTHAASVTLAWDTDSGAAGYRLYYGTSSGNYSQSMDVGNQTTATVSNLTAGQTYYFAVAAYNSSGLESQPSNQVTYNSSQATAV
jgi:hypothetical protein